MTIDNSFCIKKLKKAKEILVLFSQATRMPFIECDEETFDDCVHVFLADDQAKAFAVPYTEKKIPLMAVKMQSAQTQSFFLSLHSLGANAIKFHEGDAANIIELSEIAPLNNIDKMRAEPIPVYNPELQLSAIYFLQELRRPTEHDMEVLRDLEEEMVANFAKSKFIVSMITVPGKDGEKDQVSLPYVKTKEGDIYQPVFSEITEIQRHFKGKTEGIKMRALSFAELSKFLMPEAKGFVINPSGFNLPLFKEQYEMLVGRLNGEQKRPVSKPLDQAIQDVLDVQKAAEMQKEAEELKKQEDVLKHE